MSDMTCEAAKPKLPEWVRGELGQRAALELAEHLEGCAECREEGALLHTLSHARPVPPPGLEERIRGALRDEQLQASPPTMERLAVVSGRARGTYSGLAAAAVVGLALGTAVIWPQVRARTASPLPAVEMDPGMWLESWSAQDGIIAGAPVLEELTDEQLLTLLEELEG